MIYLHTQIDKRAISPDLEQTAKIAAAYAEGLESQGVIATLKHFPGLGRIREDAHYFAANLTAPVAELEKSDWKPFREVARVGRRLVMLGHVTVDALDDENPVSFSRTVIQDVLRGQWQHEGVLITDDLTMRAAYRHGLCGVAVKAINAGVDYLLVSYDTDKFYGMLYCARKAYGREPLMCPCLKRARHGANHFSGKNGIHG